ncbi:MAG TPA: peroxiredoxin [Terriglobales bacterium]|nr:peroxiredoxin [Terriglobales bacterium]
MSTETTPNRIPRINDPAPEIVGKSTHGQIRITDYTSKGKWVMLFSHPADFTPVCTTEFVEFARRHADFERLNVQPIGVSIDSIYSHIAWIRNIEENFKVKVQFPLIADLDQKVAYAFGMVHEAVSDTATVRAVFFIDPKNTIRALLYYPQNMGRSVDELLRVFEGLQTSEQFACSIPANWKRGDAVMVGAPITQADAEKRVATNGSGLDVTDWYFSKKKLAEAAAKQAS